MPFDFDKLNNKVHNGILPPSMLLCNAYLPSELLRQTPEFNDPKNYPFYYHLGLQFAGSKIVHATASDGLVDLCLLTGARNPEQYMAFHEKTDDYFESYCLHNIRKAYNSPFEFVSGTREEFKSKVSQTKWSLALVTKPVDNLLEFLELLWSNLAEQGLLVVDYIKSGNTSFSTFCLSHNREFKQIDTRNGTGILMR